LTDPPDSTDAGPPAHHPRGADAPGTASDPPATDRPGTDAPDAIGPTGLTSAASVGLVAVGGTLGAACRDELELLIPASPDGFPWATFVVNISGAVVLGALLTLIVGRWAGDRRARLARPLVATGFIGAYTTWSTYIVEVAVLAKDGSAGVALGYLAASLVAGLTAAAAGVRLASTRTGRRRHPPVAS
jgi:CrcB protein